MRSTRGRSGPLLAVLLLVSGCVSVEGLAKFFLAFDSSGQPAAYVNQGKVISEPAREQQFVKLLVCTSEPCNLATNNFVDSSYDGVEIYANVVTANAGGPLKNMDDSYTSPTQVFGSMVKHVKDHAVLFDDLMLTQTGAFMIVMTCTGGDSVCKGVTSNMFNVQSAGGRYIATQAGRHLPVENLVDTIKARAPVDSGFVVDSFSTGSTGTLDAMTLLWSVYGTFGANGEVPLEKASGLRSLSYPKLLISPGMMAPNTKYTFALTARSSYKFSVANATILTNAPPTGGSATVTPTSGWAMETAFKVSSPLSAWSDADQTANWASWTADLPLTQSFGYIDPVDGREVLVVGKAGEVQDNSPTFTLALEAGVDEASVSVFCRTFDSLGDSTVAAATATVEQRVAVASRNGSTVSYLNERLIAVGTTMPGTLTDSITISQLSTTLSAALNSSAAPPTSSESRARRDLRAALLSAVVGRSAARTAVQEMPLTYAELRALAGIVNIAVDGEMSYGTLLKSIVQLGTTMTKSSVASAFGATAGLGPESLEITSQAIGGMLAQWKRFNGTSSWTPKTVAKVWEAVTASAKAAVSRGTSTHIPGQQASRVACEHLTMESERVDPVPFGGLKQNTSTVQLEGVSFWMGSHIADNYIGSGWGGEADQVESFVDVHLTSAAPWLVSDRAGADVMMGNVSDITIYNSSSGLAIPILIPKYEFTFDNCTFNETYQTFVRDGKNVSSCTEMRWNFTGAMNMTFNIPKSKQTVGSYFNATCSHWNLTTAAWDREGCEAWYLTKQTQQAFCRCAHLTQFSVQQIPMHIKPYGEIPMGENPVPAGYLFMIVLMIVLFCIYVFLMLYGIRVDETQELAMMKKVEKNEMKALRGQRERYRESLMGNGIDPYILTFDAQFPGDDDGLDADSQDGSGGGGGGGGSMLFSADDRPDLPFSQSDDSTIKMENWKGDAPDWKMMAVPLAETKYSLKQGRANKLAKLAAQHGAISDVTVYVQGSASKKKQEDLDDVIFENTHPLWQLVQKEHFLISIFYYYSATYSRPERVTVLYTCILSIMFLEALYMRYLEGGSAFYFIDGLFSLTPVSVAFALEPFKFVMRWLFSKGGSDRWEEFVATHGDAVADLDKEKSSADLKLNRGSAAGFTAYCDHFAYVIALLVCGMCIFTCLVLTSSFWSEKYSYFLLQIMMAFFFNGIFVESFMICCGRKMLHDCGKCCFRCFYVMCFLSTRQKAKIGQRKAAAAVSSSKIAPEQPDSPGGSGRRSPGGGSPRSNSPNGGGGGGGGGGRRGSLANSPSGRTPKKKKVQRPRVVLEAMQAVAECFENQRKSTISTVQPWSASNLKFDDKEQPDCPSWSKSFAFNFETWGKRNDAIPLHGDLPKRTRVMGLWLADDFCDMQNPKAMGQWRIDVDWKEGAVDSEGWEYAFDFYSSWYPNEEIVPRGAFVRRRRHLRTMIWDHHPPEEEGGGGGGGEDGEDAGRRKTFNAPGVKAPIRIMSYDDAGIGDDDGDGGEDCPPLPRHMKSQAHPDYKPKPISQQSGSNYVPPKGTAMYDKWVEQNKELAAENAAAERQALWDAVVFKAEDEGEMCSVDEKHGSYRVRYNGAFLNVEWVGRVSDVAKSLDIMDIDPPTEADPTSVVTLSNGAKFYNPDVAESINAPRSVRQFSITDGDDEAQSAEKDIQDKVANREKVAREMRMKQKEGLRKKKK